MRRSVKRVITLTLGGILVLLGIAGMFLPFLQGILLLLAGLYLLARESETARSLLERVRRRYPGLDRRYRKFAGRVKAFFRRNR